VGKTIVIYIKFLLNVACHKIIKIGQFCTQLLKK